ncbi:MAG: response regulator transcription factor [Selenomonadaceae bacterium]|nr:response regulator transcription factor [Selenomonadaceae bacterium]
MNIAIVDDEKDELQAAERYLRDFLAKNYSKLLSDTKIQTFSAPDDFLRVFKPGLFQLVILDIIMGEINGFQTAQIIRARGDDDVNIVFLTNNDNFVLNGYRVFAVGYFLKPISNHEDDFVSTFNHIFHKICRKSPEIILNVNGTDVIVPFRNIFYVDIDYRHRLCVYLADGKKFVTNNNYTEIFDVLSTDERFLECYHRIIINMDYVKSMEPDDFTLLDGTSIPISQRKKKGVKVAFMRYFAHK